MTGFGIFRRWLGKEAPCAGTGAIRYLIVRQRWTRWKGIRMGKQRNC